MTKASKRTGASRPTADHPDIWRSVAGREEVREHYERQLAAWSVRLRRHELDTDHGRTFVLMCGPDDGPAVVLLHGAGSNSSVWHDAVESLVADHRVIMVDLLGEPGLSEAVRPDLTTSASADWLGQVLDQLGVREAALAGMSFGGWTATDFATRYPERVRRLALLCPAGIGRQATWGLAGAFLLQFFGEFGRRRSVQLITGLAVDRHPEVLTEVSLMFRNFQPRTGTYPVFEDERLRRLTMPVFAILGERDRVFDPMETRQRLTTLVPDVRTHIELGAGHALVDQSERVTRFLTE